MTTRRPDLTGVTFRKSSYSGGHNNCLEVGHADKLVGIRDTKNRAEGTITVPRTTWLAFIRQVSSEARR